MTTVLPGLSALVLVWLRQHWLTTANSLPRLLTQTVITNFATQPSGMG
jgi:hypothetical protein